jgi:hypothetical protein
MKALRRPLCGKRYPRNSDWRQFRSWFAVPSLIHASRAASRSVRMSLTGLSGIAKAPCQESHCRIPKTGYSHAQAAPGGRGRAAQWETPV